MNSAPHNISAITDISANIFTLLIFILIMMLAAQERPVSALKPALWSTLKRTWLA